VTPDETVARLDKEQWIAYLIEKYGMTLIEIDGTREPHLNEVEGSTVTVRYLLPVVPSETLELIFQYKLGSSLILTSHSVDDISYNPVGGYLTIDSPADPNVVNGQKKFLHDQIQSWNNDIEVNNQDYSRLARQLVDRRISVLIEKRRSLDALEQATGIKLLRKADLHSVIPVSVRVKKIIEPLRVRDREQRFTLNAETLAGILELLNNQGRQFERTPTVFSRLKEEDLRDIMLSSINAVFEGKAVGEAFQGLGKADIHLRISKGEIFIAEVKWWGGPASTTEATQQLLERLTWHESSGVVVILSRNADFGGVRKSLKNMILTIPGASGVVKEIEPNHLSCRFNLPSDVSKQVDVRYLVYNLFTTRPSGRSAMKNRGT
jgi:hypothetical protein